MNTIAWNRTLMEIIVNRNDVGLIPPGRVSRGRSACETAPVTGSIVWRISPSPSTQTRQSVCGRSSASSSAHVTGRASRYCDHA